MRKNPDEEGEVEPPWLFGLGWLRFILFFCFTIYSFTNVSYCTIATETLFEHAKKHRDFSVHVVVYPHFCLAGIQTVETA